MIAPTEILLRLVVAAVLAGVIGFYRERHEGTAGLRTHMLVGLGAALAIIVSAFGFADVLGRPAVVLDPSRIAAQVISGIGFLGAGAILFLHREEIVRGLTTAAGLWTVAAIGLAAGSGLYVAALLATAIAWAILAMLKLLERRLFARSHRRCMRLQIRPGALGLGELETAAAGQGLRLLQFTLHREDGADRIDVLFNHGAADAQLAALADMLRKLDGLKSVQLESVS